MEIKMSSLVKSKKNRKISPKLIAFWSIIAAITLGLLIALVVIFIQNLSLNDKDDIEYLSGNEIFKQEDDSYYVLIYDFDSTEEDIDYVEKVVLEYLTFLKKYEGKELDGKVTALKLYGVDSALPENYAMLVNDVDDENITGASAVFDNLASDKTKLLRVCKSELPVLVTITNGSVSAVTENQNSVLGFLQNIMDSYTK